MSIRYMSWVWEHSPHKGSALLLLLAIADMANDDGISWPGLNRLSQKTRLGRRYVIDLIDELEKSGAIIIKHRKNGELNLSNIYQIVISPDEVVNDRSLPSERKDLAGSEPQATRVVNPSSPGSEPHTTTPSEPQATRVVNPSSPESSINHQFKTSIKHHGSGENATPPDDPFDQLRDVITASGILPQTANDAEEIIKMVNLGITAQDIRDGIAWKNENNDGKPIRYIYQLTGPSTTAMRKRLQQSIGQNGNGKPKRKRVLTDAYGNTVEEEY